MVTFSVIVGRGEAGAIVCTPLPGMWNLMVSAPETRLASPIASLRVHSLLSHPPLPGSAVELTVRVRSARAGLLAPSAKRPATTSVARKLSAAAAAPTLFGCVALSLDGRSGRSRPPADDPRGAGATSVCRCELVHRLPQLVISSTPSVKLRE